MENPSIGNRRIKVAIACPGVGVVQRGFERMSSDLFKLLQEDLDLTLFKGGGPVSCNQKRLWYISSHGSFLKYLPIHKLVGRKPMHVEYFTFAISLLWAIRGQGYEVIHCIDPPLARFLYKLRNWFGFDFRLLYSEATAMPPGDYPPADHMHQISQVTYDEAREYGIPEAYMTTIPLGIYPEIFLVESSREELRNKHDISEKTFVVVCLAAINRYHKRIDYLIDEFRAVKGDVLLWIDGSPHHGDLDLINYAKEVLGERCRISHLPSAQVGELFAVSDLMVHPSLFEAFGLAMVEAASAGVPVLTHNAAHFVWLMNNRSCVLDMSARGELAARVNQLVMNRSELAQLNNREEIIGKYSWPLLKESYLDLYRKLAELTDDETRRAHSFGLR